MTTWPDDASERSGSPWRLLRRLSATLLSTAALVAVAPAAAAPPPVPEHAPAPPGAWTAPVIAVVGGRVIDGYGQAPIENGTVLIKGERIVAVGSKAEVPVPAGAKVIDASGRTVIPGMIEMHAHLITLGDGNYPRWFKWLDDHKDKYPLEKVMEISARQLLASGVTTAVDLGAPLEPSLQVRDRINKGEVMGPRLMVSGPWIIPKAAIFPDASSRVVGYSAEAAAKATQANVDAGVDIIKAHGDLTGEQYKAIADVAHKGGIMVTAHINDEDAIWNALKAHVDILQHVGSASRPTYSDAMVKAVVNSNTAIVPTAAGSYTLPATVKFPERLQDPILHVLTPPDIWDEIQDSLKDIRRVGYFGNVEKANILRAASVKQWLESGARFGIGTDNGVPATFHTDALIMIGKLYVSLGASPMWVIDQMTKGNAEILRKRDIGTLEPGKYADLVILRGDPLDNLSALANVETVIKNGQVYKGGLTLSFEQGQAK
jgi:imidazolonepropionase-like amidohydrolase